MTDRNSLEDRLGYHFKDGSLLNLALTHRSVIAEDTSAVINKTNERLEFLGDRVLGLAVVQLLLESFPDESEGQLAQRFSVLASAKTLHLVAIEIDLAPHIKMGANMDMADAIVSDACEALIGAVYLDAGFESARSVVLRHWQSLMDAAISPPKDAKTALQEWAQERGLPLPKYDLVDRSGPDHAPQFTMAVAIEGHEPSSGGGSSKRAAAQKAAEAMLAILA
jgi:ribonuclease-3